MRFSPLFRTGLAVIMVAPLGGCATNGGPSPGVCAAIGAGVGAVGGGVGGGLYSANNTDRDHNEWEGAGIAAASTVVGAGLGYLVCSLMEEEPKPEPRRAQAPPPPKPAPTPPPAPARPDPCAGLVRLEGIKFDNDKSVLGPNAPAILDETVTALQRCPEKRVSLSAYTDSNGSSKYNEALSQRRADSVREYLVSHGVAASRIEARGLGESNPVADNSTPEGRAENRRVELEPID
jgi:OOP family OmpA-OmpF porin